MSPSSLNFPDKQRMNQKHFIVQLDFFAPKNNLNSQSNGKYCFLRSGVSFKLKHDYGNYFILYEIILI